MRVAERAGGGGPTARVRGVAVAATAAAAAACRSRESGLAGAKLASDVTDVGWPVLLRAAGDTESPRGGSRRARPGLAVTHGHADADCAPREARLPPL